MGTGSSDKLRINPYIYIVACSCSATNNLRGFWITYFDLLDHTDTCNYTELPKIQECHSKVKISLLQAMEAHRVA
jgi:hypothetical protein